MNNGKVCNQCKEKKPVTAFYKASKGGLAHICKKCTLARAKAKRDASSIEYYDVNEFRKFYRF